MYLNQEDIIKITDCPECGAIRGLQCLSFKKKENTREHSHRARYDKALFLLEGGFKW